MAKNRSNESIYYANRGIERNKKPLKNREYRIDVVKCGLYCDPEEYKEVNREFWFKDLGALILYSRLEDASKKPDEDFAWHGPVTPDYVKELLGENQWSKFCQGKRRFVQQRRVNGKNVKLGEKFDIL